MSHALRFQVLVIPNVPWPEYLDRFLRLEGLGFEVAAVPDHFCDWGNPSGPWLEAWTALAAIAARTSTMRLTTCVTQIPLRNPAVLAHQAVTVDQISGGRLELGIGTGLTIDPSYEMVGLPNWSTGERVARFAEYIELLDHLLAEGVTTYHGAHYKATGAVMNPGSVQQPRLPIMVAALGPQMMRHAAEHADIWNSLSFAADFDEQLAELGDRCMTMDELCAEVGRDPTSLRRSYTMFDPKARASGGAIRYYESDDVFVDTVRRVTDLGITEVSLYYPAVEAQLPAFERIATEVLPVLRREHA
ncbi:MAG: LLM class flavin-dependent oxidoreductase [Actinomycetota bacterium]|nr:LLM class flavin-dependent oxidoreductase [Actinomycetota bacterium]